ncbi:beta-1,3-galactosyltransferase 1-like [Gambusia affinis]|uniref:beta-1,3-galactosyltransferase 1-like n=1 Tax=Gambusia affinis TaxID=33528 RepID=UPI001CDBA4FB|nr:beta-1,3-galactosyltransferase 1-like [Gambusia affinis]XP_043961249.1 beta-1,3-galactosyltransferase 1-like [Gambusia affinis]XP_043961258.1 beta-1,3-galactosyltransferase 1-like [Gambusia affinis]
MKNDVRPAENRRCFGFSRRHNFLFLVVLGVVLFVYCTNIRDTGPEWNPKEWMKNHSTKLLTVFGKQSNVSKNTGFTGFPDGNSAAELPETTSVATTQEPTTQQQRTVSSRVTKKTPETQTAQRIAAPYVSPGPYLVEYPYEYHFTINEELKCKQENPFVVLIVQVAPRNRAHRDIIRNSWGSEKLVNNQVVALFFLLGMQTGDDAEQVHRQLLQESREHHDLIQGDFVDCYKNLTIKTMVMLEWLNSYCSSAAYAMKIDSDMFLNVPNLVDLLLKAPRTNYMTGLVTQGGRVSRNPNSKWFLPIEVFSEDVYPPYALGLGYILSLDLTKKLVEASRHIKPLYIEDIYLGLCMRHLGIHLTDPSGYSFHFFPIQYSRCKYSKIIATTTLENMDRLWIWRDFKKPGRYC